MKVKLRTILGFAVCVLLVLWFMDWRAGRSAEVERSFVGVESLYVQADVGEVIILPTNEEDVQVEFRGRNARDFQYDLENGELEINLNQSSWRFFNNKEARLYIYLPREAYEQIQVEVNVGRIQIESLEAEQFLLRTNVGEIQVYDVEGAIRARSDVGEINVRLREVRADIELIANVGEVDLTLEEKPMDAVISLNTNIGESRIFGERSTYERFGNGTFRLDLTSDIGEVSVHHGR